MNAEESKNIEMVQRKIIHFKKELYNDIIYPKQEIDIEMSKKEKVEQKFDENMHGGIVNVEN